MTTTLLDNIGRLLTLDNPALRTARASRLPDRGLVSVGARADLVWWDAEHEGAFAWQWGVEPVAVWRAGEAADLA